MNRLEHCASATTINRSLEVVRTILNRAASSYRNADGRPWLDDGAGWEYLFVAVDDHARLGYSEMKANERGVSASEFLRGCVRYFGRLGVTMRRVLTDNGSAFRSKQFAVACRKLGLRHVFTRFYRPQTNGKAERFIQSALREWAYGMPYRHSLERTAMLGRWTHHYNWHRPHHGIGRVAPDSRLAQSRNNLLALHS